jgi:hypothetical protein
LFNTANTVLLGASPRKVTPVTAREHLPSQGETYARPLENGRYLGEYIEQRHPYGERAPR